MLYVSPQFRVSAEPGTFRIEPYENPFSPALNATVYEQEETKDLPASAAKAHEKSFDDFRNRSIGGKAARVLPVRLAFPAFGASLFLASELTAEGQAPAIELSYQREKKEGSK